MTMRRGDWSQRRSGDVVGSEKPGGQSRRGDLRTRTTPSVKGDQIEGAQAAVVVTGRRVPVADRSARLLDATAWWSGVKIHPRRCGSGTACYG
jgi:hypothetical protein